MKHDNLPKQFIDSLNEFMQIIYGKCHGQFQEFAEVSGKLFFTLDTGIRFQFVINEKICTTEPCQGSYSLITNSYVEAHHSLENNMNQERLCVAQSCQSEKENNVENINTQTSRDTDWYPDILDDINENERPDDNDIVNYEDNCYEIKITDSSSPKSMSKGK